MKSKPDPEGLGRLGENVVAYLMRVQLNPLTDKYNDVCDGYMIDTGETVEIKTCRIYLNFLGTGRPAFTCEASQARKCVNAGRLFFCGVPEPNSDIVRVYEATSRNYTPYTHPRTGKPMIGFLDFVELRNTGHQPILAAEMRKKSGAEWNRYAKNIIL